MVSFSLAEELYTVKYLFPTSPYVKGRGTLIQWRIKKRIMRNAINDPKAECS